MSDTPDRQAHADYLWLTELQFRLCVDLDMRENGGSSVDGLHEWSYGQHTVTGDQLKLSPEGRGLAAHHLQRTLTYLLCVVAVRAFKDVLVPDQTNMSEKQIVDKVRKAYPTDPDRLAAFEIVRLIRNAYAHQPYKPEWSIGPTFQPVVLRVANLIELDTTNKDGKELQWQDYGGLLALWHLSQWIRVNVLDDAAHPAKLIRPE